MKKLCLILLGLPTGAVAMDKCSPREMPKKIVKELVRKAIDEEARKKEVDTAIIHIGDEKAVMAVIDKIFIVDHKKGVIDKQLLMQARANRNSIPEIVALGSIKNSMGSTEERFLMAEDKGRILILDDKECELKMIGDVKGKVLSIASNSSGNQIAVHFTQDSSEKLISSIALSVAYPKRQYEAKILADKTCMWVTKDMWQWTQFITKQFDYDIEALTFEEEQLIVQSADYWENWNIKDPESNPVFILNARMKRKK